MDQQTEPVVKTKGGPNHAAALLEWAGECRQDGGIMTALSG